MAPQETAAGPNIDSTLQETRSFPPPPDFSKNAHIRTEEDYEKLRAHAAADPEAFWADIAKQLHWFKPWDKVLEWESPWAKWFVGGKINLSYNCLDRHVATWRKNKAAIIWESEPGEVRTLTYQQLLIEVKKCANVLKSLGIKSGDRVAIYMGMCPELPIAMLACARIGAPHSVIFGGFSANALVDRITDQEAVAVITQDGSYRRGGEVKLKPAVDEALERCPTVKNVLVYKRTGYRGRVEGRPRSLVARLDGEGQRRLPRRTSRLRASALHPLHLRYHGQTEGHRAHHRRLLGGNVHHQQMGLRSERGRYLLVHGRHRMGHRSQLYRLRPAAERRDLRHVRRRARTGLPSIASGRSSRSTRSTSCTPRPRRSAPSSSGATSGRRSTTSPACACWEPWASRSILKPGCGIARSSAAIAARSSTPGGRPKPAQS